MMQPRPVPQAILALLLVVLFCPRVAGLDPSRKISQYGRNMWRIQDGFACSAGSHYPNSGWLSLGRHGRGTGPL